MDNNAKTLVYVIVKFSCDAATFFFLRLNHAPADSRKCFGRFFALGDIYAGADVAGKRTVRIKSWHASVEHPSIFPVLLPEPILPLERLTPIECLCVSLQALLVNPQDALPQPSRFQAASQAGDR